MRFLILLILLAPSLGLAADPAIEAALRKEIIGPRTALIETQEFVDAKIPRLVAPKTAAEWDREAERMREKVKNDVIFRGEAAKWRDAKTKVEIVETVKGGEGYTLKKLRYEILPGFWIPALLYEPEKLSGKVPVSLAVNGHDRKGTAADYKQIRCINMAKRGMIVLNVEWLGMGQLNIPGDAHGAMNQLNLCGSGGIAPFYLSMSRGLDILLAHPNADPKRVAVSGLSGGGWQTIFISSLDTRVTLANPVAGYSSYRTRVLEGKDLGDSEQTPSDLATVADYLHLTAMRAPHPTLLTFNSKDNCCFAAGTALPPLKDGCLPIYRLYKAEDALRSHVNDVPGDHNFGKENREALYKMIGDFFYPGDKTYKAEEITCDKEVKSREELNVPLPADNLDLNSLARSLMANLPRHNDMPKEKEKLESWRKERSAALDRLIRFVDFGKNIVNTEVAKTEQNGLTIRSSKLQLGKQWTVPVVEFTKGKFKGTTVVLSDEGRVATSAKIEELLNAGHRVIAVDIWYFGEAKPIRHDWLWGLMLDTVGQRPFGVQAGQLAAVCGWAAGEGEGKVAVAAVGPRVSVIALLAAVEAKAIDSLELTKPLGSFKEIIEKNQVVATAPEQFCFGLLDEFDVKQIAALVAPRKISIKQASERATKEFAELKEIYKLLGVELDPLR
ncbi:MAG: hypothetical protein K8T89_13350 [Planctomycetes bacterium]|nr:hypothetical protein [Planctomycetota bacterium]